MDYRVLAALQSLEGLLDYVLAGLRQHLNGDVVRDEVILYQGAAEVVLRLRCRGKAYLSSFSPRLIGMTSA